MNYTEVKDAALAYSNRKDVEVTDNMDNFLQIVEAQINRNIHVQKQSKRAIIQMVDGQEYYGLPADFGGLRDIESKGADTPNTRLTYKYRNPEQFNTAVSNDAQTCIYTIIADQLQIWPTADGDVLEIVYYATLPPLGTLNPENWLSKKYPDAYVFGLLVEISAFAKDGEAATLWNGRFTAALAGIQDHDHHDRWSGTALQVNLG